MINSYFMLMDYAVSRDLGLNIDQGRGIVTFRNKKTNDYIQLKVDIDVKVTIEKVEKWLYSDKEDKENV